MSFSLFALALWVFLQSATAFNWFTVDPKFTAVVGLLFVAIVVVEAVLARPALLSRFRRGE